MSKFDRIYELHDLLKARRTPVSLTDLTDRLECSEATVKRTIRKLREEFDAPISSRAEGYLLDKGSDYSELPGLWFNSSELYALLAMHRLLEQTDPGLFRDKLSSLRNRIEKILTSQGLDSAQFLQRFRILGPGFRNYAVDHFRLVADGVLRRCRLNISYHSRRENLQSEREVSPQRLIHYRNNWYLDGWCHRRRALRIFALDRIHRVKRSDREIKEIPAAELDRYFGSGYGIFAGLATEKAVLHFTRVQARWAAEESWHPDQEGRFLPDGSFELSLPYSDPTELIQDILRYSPGVEVKNPPELRREVADRLREALSQYE
ncbi:MAG: helix-turn-helix transcriptional regulator [Desulfurivibrionaceae bacterium]